ncbi:ROK family transcriptional regulator [Novosphingobium sp. 9]|uniref:ROK family transcriptional regulator n=1 Tax=Novosphingobium sp. 9 TaxID=2025349 RepID=UPI0021B5C18F|nr:ROK family transcriptional regulator [Novosphingobium sp. 9]
MDDSEGALSRRFGNFSGVESRLTLSLSGTNLERAGDYNQRIVLQAIRLAGETTRVELAGITGLTAPTIANITRRLAETGLVRPGGRLQGKRGQPAKRIVIVPEGAFAIGLNIDRDHISLAAVDLAGQVRFRHTLEIPFALPDAVAAHVAAVLPELMVSAGIAPERVLGVGIALPDDLGRIALPHRPQGYEAWDGLDLQALFAQALPWPLYLDNDAAAAALGELHLGDGIALPGFFYLLISAGLGGGLVIDKSYVRGADSRSGEIWAMPDPPAGPDAVVQDTVSLLALYERLEAAGFPVDHPAALAAISAEAEPVIERWLDDAARSLTAPLIAMNCLINPSAVLIGGRLPGDLADGLVERLSAGLVGAKIPAVAPVQRARMADDAPAIGAAMIPFLDQLLASESILMQAGR